MRNRISFPGRTAPPVLPTSFGSTATRIASPRPTSAASQLAPALLGLLLLLGTPALNGCAGPARNRTLVVTATAYNSLPAQTQGDPSVGAWGDTLRAEIPSIAVSRDLIAMGLDRGTRVRIEGFRREFIVLDKMASKWKKRIDIHMGKDRKAALQWGKRKVEILWSTGS